ncbi:MAG: hypothetical protein NTY76_00720 [Candidatus Omnitrophica bacterium]|nr:hypothetical protein [Candidatus Omnitrophota bacterium]
MRYPVIVLTLIIAATFSLPHTYAEQHQKERYLEDTVKVDNKLVKIKIDFDARKVVYFWDEGANKWADASLYPADLNKAYSEKRAFQEMQGELDGLKDETWDDRYRSR